jgi:hypothetical protein
VAVPVVLDNENAAAATAHDNAFLSVTSWLKAQPGAGNVLTVASASRWTEALSGRAAFTVGPEWLLFDQFQIADTQESYWALTSQYAISDNRVALSFSGFSSPDLSQAPMYTPFVQGVEFPVLRVLPGSLSVNASGPEGAGAFPLEGDLAPTVTPGPPGTSEITARYTAHVATLTELATTLPNGTARVQFLVTPAPGEIVRSFSFEVAPPPTESTVLSTDAPSGIALHGSTLSWSVTGKLGQYPKLVTVASEVAFRPGPVSARTPAASLAHTWNLTFSDPNGSAPFSVGADFSTVGASNPAATLPTAFSTQTFLTNNSIQFLLWPGGSKAAAEIGYFGATFGFSEAFENSQWFVLQRR